MNNRVMMYGVCEMAVNNFKNFIESAPVTICLTHNRSNLFKFLDDYILDFIKFTDEEDKHEDEYTEISIEVDRNWWKNLNNKQFPIKPDNYPERIIIKHTYTSINSTHYTVLYINKGPIAFV